MPAEPESRLPRVVIVGGGFSGAATAFHLLRGARSLIDVVLVDTAARVGRGLAYSTSSEHHLLNVPAGRLGLDPADESHFHAWLRQQGQAFGAHARAAGRLARCAIAAAARREPARDRA